MLAHCKAGAFCQLGIGVLILQDTALVQVLTEHMSHILHHTPFAITAASVWCPPLWASPQLPSTTLHVTAATMPSRAHVKQCLPAKMGPLQLL